jgi:hypothetical protein
LCLKYLDNRIVLISSGPERRVEHRLRPRLVRLVQRPRVRFIYGLYGQLGN